MADPRQIKLANQMPLNRAAKGFLPEEWQNRGELHVLSLMRWGLANGIKIEPKALNHPDQDEVETRINLLADMDPRKPMTFLVDPEESGDEALTAEELLAEETLLDAASLLLETLHGNMVATAP